MAGRLGCSAIRHEVPRVIAGRMPQARYLAFNKAVAVCRELSVSIRSKGRAIAAATCMGLWLACIPAAEAGQARSFNDSGQDLCSVGGTWKDRCTGSGQDAEFGRDVTKPGNSGGRLGFNFQKVCNSGEVAQEGSCPASPVLGSGPNDWGCTLDVVTGLMWELKTTDGGPRDVNASYTGSGRRGRTEVAGYLQALNSTALCGYSDWRVPLLMEIQGTVDYGVTEDRSAHHLLIDEAWFPNSMNQYFSSNWWAAEKVNNACMQLSLTNGQIYRSSCHTPANVRAVRSHRERMGTATRFTTSDSEVFDALTGLVWRRCHEGQTWNGTTCNGKATLFTWIGALKYVKTLQGNSAGWRLPNVKELQSAAMMGEGRSAWDDEIFPNGFRGLAQTSTPVVLDSQKNWVVSFSTGVSFRVYRHFTGAVRLAREADQPQTEEYGSNGGVR
jgi:Protein of unknown function (DUF1566)